MSLRVGYQLDLRPVERDADELLEQQRRLSVARRQARVSGSRLRLEAIQVQRAAVRLRSSLARLGRRRRAR